MKNIVVAFVLAGLMISFSPEHAAAWAVSGSIPLGGTGGWDYATMDGPNQRLFVTHGDHILVVELKTQKVIGSLDSAGSHGVALAPDLNRGFISNGTSGLVTIFDLKTLKPVQSVKVGEHPDAICYEPVTKRVFVFNGASKTASVIDATTGQVAGEIPLPGKPEFAGADDQGFVFDNIEDQGIVVKIDAAKMTIVAQWHLPTRNEPSALAVDGTRHRLFAGCGSKKLFVLDCATGVVVAALPIGAGVDADVYDPAGQRVFASCGDGTLTVIKQTGADTYAIEQVVPTEKGARTMAFDSETQTAYLPDGKFGPPPAPTAEHPHPRPSILPGSLKLIVVAQKSP